jgi:hypothetical protein
MTAVGTKKETRWHLELKQRWVDQYNFYLNDSDGAGCSSSHAAQWSVLSIFSSMLLESKSLEVNAMFTGTKFSLESE